LAAEAVAAPGPKRLQMHMLTDVPAAELSKALRRGVLRNSPEADRIPLGPPLEALAARIDALGTLRKGEVDAGLQGRALTPVDQVGRHAGTAGQGLVAGIVRRSVIDDDDLGVGRDAAHDLRDHGAFIEGGDHEPEGIVPGHGF
jgi:hypothetical protein